MNKLMTVNDVINILALTFDAICEVILGDNTTLQNDPNNSCPGL